MASKSLVQIGLQDRIGKAWQRDGSNGYAAQGIAHGQRSEPLKTKFRLYPYQITVQLLNLCGMALASI
jgi:hypothetical protein